MGNEKLPWIQNKKFRYPGWHFFEKVETSQNYNGNVQAIFSTEKLKNDPLYMKLFIPGSEQREYTKVMAPYTFEAPSPYEDLPTPTLVIRKTGEAWNTPFAVVYEPISKNKNSNTVQSVDKIEQNGIFKGLKVTSKIAGKELIQYVIDQAGSVNFIDSKLGMQFTGRFAIVTTNEKNKIINMYMGDGERLTFGKYSLVSEDGNSGAFLDCTLKTPVLKSNKKVKFITQ